MIARAASVALILVLLAGWTASAAPASTGDRSLAVARGWASIGRGAEATAEAALRPSAVRRYAIPGSLSDDAVPVHGQPIRHVTRTGIASTYGPGWSGWIAWPQGPGWRLRVCGPGGCVVVVTTDAGPDRAMQRAGRIVDLDVETFERVAGAPWTVGLTKVTVTVLGQVPSSPEDDAQS